MNRWRWAALAVLVVGLAVSFLTAGEALHGALTPEEFSRFEEHVPPLADSGSGLIRDASAYLWAVK